jgi:hypothetical protein
MVNLLLNFLSAHMEAIVTFVASCIMTALRQKWAPSVATDLLPPELPK